MTKKNFLALLLIVFGLLLSCKKEENNPPANTPAPTDKRDLCIGKYDCKQYVYNKAGAMLQLIDSSAYELEIKKNASDSSGIDLYKGSELLLNANNAQLLSNNSKVLTFDIPAQTYRYLGIDRNATGEPYFFTGSNYKHGGYIDSTKVCQFAITHPADYPGFSIVHRFNCTKK